MASNPQLEKKIDDLLNKAEGFMQELVQIKQFIIENRNSEEQKEEEIAPIIAQPEVEVVNTDVIVEQKEMVIEQPSEKPEIAFEIQPVIENEVVEIEKLPLVETRIDPKPEQVNIPKKKEARDLEKFVGENLINKIGIGVLVLGIGFFVKYAIDKNWIGEVARMFVGIIAGGGLIGIAFWLRKQYKAFSSVLIGGGIAVLYFTFAIAYREYGIINQTVAFILMVAITGFTVFLATSFNRVELAVIALIGGFASPIMASSGNGNYVVLFSYLMILNVGMLTLAYYKNWNLINIICYALTLVFYAVWLITSVLDVHKDSYIGALVFAGLFYLVFFFTNIIYNIKERRKFGAFEIIMLITNVFFFYVVGMLLFKEYKIEYYQGVFTGCIGLFNLVFSFYLYKNIKIDNVLRFLLIGITITLISLIAPVELKGNYITLFWAAEAVLLYWISEKSKIKLLNIFSVVLLFLSLNSLFSDWINGYAFYNDFEVNMTVPVVFNKIFCTSLFVCAAIFLNIFLLKDSSQKVIGLSKVIYRTLLINIAVVVLYFGIHFELVYQLPKFFLSSNVRAIILFSYNALFFTVLLHFVKRNAARFYIISIGILTALVTFIYPFGMHMSNVVIRNDYLFNSGGSLGEFLFHYVNVLLVLAALASIMKVIIAKAGIKSVLMNFFYWYLVIMLVYIGSAELGNLNLLINIGDGVGFREIENSSVRIGYPVLWSVMSLIIMVIGLKRRIKMLRIISLSLFLLTLVKLFSYDIMDISDGGKIIAFIILGVILLLVSFLYQKLKRILFDFEKENNDN